MAKVSRVSILLLRLLAVTAAFGATIVMAISHQSTTYFGVTMEAKFQYTPSFIFFVVANSVATLYGLLILFMRPFGSPSRFVLMADVVIGMLLTGAVAATGALSEVGKNGDSHAGWLPICSRIENYCNSVMGALIAAFAGLVIHFVMLLYSISTLTSSVFD